MKVHANAKLGPKGRLVMVERVVGRGWSLAEAAAAAGVSDRTCRKWVDRYLAGGEAGLLDRPSAPKCVHNRTDERRIEVIACLRRLRLTGAEIAEVLRMPGTTVSGILTSIGMGKLGRLGLEPAQSYERGRPGELVHIDVKKLGRIPEGRAGHRVHGDRRLQRSPRKRDAAGRDRKLVGWEYVTSASTTRRGWPTSRCLPTRRQRPRSRSSAAPSASSAGTASESKRS